MPASLKRWQSYDQLAILRVDESLGEAEVVNTRRFRTTTWCFTWLMTSLLLVMPQTVMGDPMLRKLECVTIQAAVMESGASFGITTETLRAALLAGIKAKLPRLKVDPSCSNRIYFKVFMQNIAAGNFDGFAGHVAFDVRRKATFTDTSEPIDARAFDLESYIHGTRDKAKTSVLDQLNSHLAQFAADYAAANP